MTVLFHYSARSGDGARLRGSVEAADAAAALRRLRSRALFVTSLEPSASVRGAVAGVLAGHVSRSAMVSFFRSFSVLAKAGVPMRRSLDVTLNQCADPRLREALSAVVSEVENGLALSEAMAHRPREFAPVHVALIRAGEAGGVLDEVLERLAALLERDRDARKRLGAALVYPAFVATAAVGLLLFLLTSVVPMFRSMYEQMRVPLPPITAILIVLGEALKSPSVAAVAIAVGSFGVFAAARMGGAVRERVLMRLPLLGAIVRKSTLATVARMLGTLLRSGVGVIPSLDVLTDAVTSRAFRESLRHLRQGLAAGTAFTEALAQSGLYEPLFLQMVRVGEESGALDAMLLRIADYYDVDVEAALAALGAVVEPFMILLLGGAVAFITAAVFIPLYTLIGSLK